jgi:glyoxylase-like metal-dependent hydrolase (beta-lactamase superfamily II)
MKFLLLSLMCVAALGIVGSILAQQNGFGGHFPEGTFVFAQPDLKIVAIDETPGRTMNANLFSAADPEIVKKYMPGDSAPASVTTFVLFAGEDTVLFDTGLGNEMWGKKMTDLGLKPENVKLILLTHFHGDHIGGLLQGNVRRFPNARVLASAPEYESGQGQQSIEKIQRAYGQNFAKFNFNDEVFANSLVKVKALDAVGHTPGHTVFLIESTREGKEKLLIIGDLLHAAALQFPVPEVCASFDKDHEKAIVSRKRILDFAAQETIPVGGMHIPPPSMGTVKKEGKGYSFELKK